MLQNYTLQQEFLATNFRMVLVKFNVTTRFVADERSFYFAVKDWYIRGSCYCHGQSAECNTKVIYYVEITECSIRQIKITVNNLETRKIKQGSGEACKITNVLVVHSDLSGST